VILPSQAIDPGAGGDPAVAASLLVVRRAYSVLKAPLVAKIGQLASQHLDATRPEMLVVKPTNGKQRFYARVSQPTNDEVGSRQARRRAVPATTAVGRLFAVDPGLVAFKMAESARQAAASRGTAEVPSAVLAALPAFLQSQVLLDNGVSGSLWWRFRLLFGPKSGLATTQALRADMRAAKAEPRTAATTNGSGAFLVAARLALRGMIDDLCDNKQYIERFVQGSDGAENASTSPFLGHASPTEMYEADLRTVQVCLGRDKGGGA